MMKRRWAVDTSRVWLVVLVAALLALLPLAWLQYRWIDQISQAEGERLEAHLRTEVSRFVEDFDGEVMRVYRTFAGGRPGGPPGQREDMAERLARWSETGSERRLVRNVYVTRRGPGGADEIERLDFASGRFVETQWPASLTGLRPRLTAPPPFQSVIEEIPALLAPHMERPHPSSPPPMRRPFGNFGGWTIVELDLQYIQKELLPELAERHFLNASDVSYDIRVVSSSDRNRVIYASNPAAIDFSKVDAVAPMLGMRFRGGGPPQLEPPGRHGGWLLLAKHRAGSLEQVTAQTRHRNLAVSFAILLILAASLLALLFTTRRAQRLAKLQMEFVAGVSHELRTPLTVICSAADNLADGVVSSQPQVQRYGTVIRGEGRRLSQMVEQILRFAGIQSGRAKYDLQTVSVHSLIERSVSTCEPEIHAAGVELETDIAEDLPPVSADVTSMTHCLRNLLDNALTHGAQGKWVGLRARRAGGFVEIRVEDRGPGIGPDELKHVFDAFYRGRRSMEEQVRGFGLGLALARRIIQAHSGTISVQSSLGKGTCVLVYLPAMPENEASGTTDSAD